MKYLAILIGSVFALSACSNKDDQSTPIQSPEEILQAKTWKADEVSITYANNSTGYYKRGGSSNTVNYDADSLKFFQGGTGTYYSNNVAYSTNWAFTNGSKTQMTLTVNYSIPITLHVTNVQLTATNFTYTETDAGATYMAIITRLPN